MLELYYSLFFFLYMYNKRYVNKTRKFPWLHFMSPLTETKRLKSLKTNNYPLIATTLCGPNKSLSITLCYDENNKKKTSIIVYVHETTNRLTCLLFWIIVTISGSHPFIYIYMYVFFKMT